MAIPTSRTNETGTISIDRDLCIGCGLCVTVCKDFGLMMDEGKVKQSLFPLFGCIACGHCMAVCPEGAIFIRGRTLSPEDLFPLPEAADIADYDGVINLYHHRRSIREFTEQEVPKEVVDKILAAAQIAPMGLPPSDVHVTVIRGKDKVRLFAEDFVKNLSSMKWLFSNPLLWMMRPFLGKENYDLFKNFINPALDAYIDFMKKGKNIVTYNAPLMLYFYGSPYCDPADPIVAATYAMTAAESLGLGTCMLGSIHPLIQHGKKAKQFRAKYQIKSTSREGLVLIVGYPAVKYQKGIRRTYASVDYVK